jgi:hypothetical protein
MNRQFMLLSINAIICRDMAGGVRSAQWLITFKYITYWPLCRADSCVARAENIATNSVTVAATAARST